MKLRLPPRTGHMPRGLRQVMEELQRLHDGQPDSPLQLDAVTAEVERHIDEAVAVNSSDAQILEAIDGLIDAYVSEWRVAMIARHRRVLNQLDMLRVRVRPFRERSGTLNDDELSKLEHLDGAVSHALDRVSDPDVPYLNPLPRPRRTER